MGTSFPTADFLKLAKGVEDEGEAFQYHVLDLVRDVIGDKETFAQVMDTLHQKLTDKDIADFIAALPAPPRNWTAGAPDVQALLKLAPAPASPHVLPTDVFQIVASELYHRKRWEKVMKDNPGTLQALKDRLR